MFSTKCLSVVESLTVQRDAGERDIAVNSIMVATQNIYQSAAHASKKNRDPTRHNKVHAMTHLFYPRRCSQPPKDSHHFLHEVFHAADHFSSPEDPRGTIVLTLLRSLLVHVAAHPSEAQVAIGALRVIARLSLLVVPGYLPTPVMSHSKSLPRNALLGDMKGDWNNHRVLNMDSARASNYIPRVHYTPLEMLPLHSSTKEISIFTQGKPEKKPTVFSTVCRRKSEMATFWSAAFLHAAMCALCGEADSRRRLIRHTNDGSALRVTEGLSAQFAHPAVGRLDQLCVTGTLVRRLLIVAREVRELCQRNPSLVGGAAVGFWSGIESFYDWLRLQAMRVHGTVGSLEAFCIHSRELVRMVQFVSKICGVDATIQSQKPSESATLVCPKCQSSWHYPLWRFHPHECFCMLPSGAPLLSALYASLHQHQMRAMDSGGSLLSRVGLCLFEYAVRSFLDSVEIWISTGKLRDPLGEFFVAVRGRVDDGFVLQPEKIPQFISLETAKAIFETGRIVRVLAGPEGPPMLLPRLPSKSPRDLVQGWVLTARRKTDRLCLILDKVDAQAQQSVLVRTTFQLITRPKAIPLPHLSAHREDSFVTPRKAPTPRAPVAVVSPVTAPSPRVRNTPRGPPESPQVTEGSPMALTRQQSLYQWRDYAIHVAREEMIREYQRRTKEAELRLQRATWRNNRLTLRKKRNVAIVALFAQDAQLPVVLFEESTPSVGEKILSTVQASFVVGQTPPRATEALPRASHHAQSFRIGEPAEAAVPSRSPSRPASTQKVTHHSQSFHIGEGNYKPEPIPEVLPPLPPLPAIPNPAVTHHAQTFRLGQQEEHLLAPTRELSITNNTARSVTAAEPISQGSSREPLEASAIPTLQMKEELEEKSSTCQFKVASGAKKGTVCGRPKPCRFHKDKEAHAAGIPLLPQTLAEITPPSSPTEVPCVTSLQQTETSLGDSEVSMVAQLVNPHIEAKAPSAVSSVVSHLLTCQFELTSGPNKGTVCGRVKPCRFHKDKDVCPTVSSDILGSETQSKQALPELTDSAATHDLTDGKTLQTGKERSSGIDSRITTLPLAATVPQLPAVSHNYHDMEPSGLDLIPSEPLVENNTEQRKEGPPRTYTRTKRLGHSKASHHTQSFDIAEMMIPPAVDTDVRLNIEEVMRATECEWDVRANRFALSSPSASSREGSESRGEGEFVGIPFPIADVVHRSITLPVEIALHNANNAAIAVLYDTVDILSVWRNEVFGVYFLQNDRFAQSFRAGVFQELCSFKPRPGQDVCQALTEAFRGALEGISVIGGTPTTSFDGVKLSLQFLPEFATKASVGRSPMEAIRAMVVTAELSPLLRNVISSSMFDKVYQPIFCCLLTWQFADFLSTQLWHYIMRSKKNVPPILTQVRMYVHSIVNVVLSYMTHTLAASVRDFLKAAEPSELDKIPTIAALQELHNSFLTSALHKLLLSVMFQKIRHLLSTLLHTIEDVYTTVVCSGVRVEMLTNSLQERSRQLTRAVDMLHDVASTTNTVESDVFAAQLLPFVSKP